MSAPLRLAAFAGVLALLFAAAAVAGGAIDPRPGKARDETAGHGMADEGGEPAMESAHAGGEAPRGVMVAGDGLRLVADRDRLAPGRSQRLRFHILDERGGVVRDFAVGHERRMHVIVVRRDLVGYQHLHPRQAADGSWEMDLRLPEPGSYRMFADFRREGRPYTLGTDVTAPGRFDPRPLPAPSSVAASGGYEAALAADGGELKFTVRRGGRRVAGIEPYLGARGHLVALRDGDLAFLHVHPQPAGAAGEIGFRVEYPSAGRYRLFLQFKHRGRVHTVAFTQEVA
jgi:hypothetical protein